MLKVYKPLFCATITSLILCNSAFATENISIASTPKGSVWNTMSNAISKVTHDKTGMTTSVQALSGYQTITDAVQNETADFAINDVNDAMIAREGKGIYHGIKHTNLRIATRISPLQIGIFVRTDSDIHSIADLRGKIVASGWNGFPLGRTHMSAILATSGLDWDAVEEVPVHSILDAADALAEDKVDATNLAVGGPKVA
ncbi:TAXI family TRAP transporter solute-binding subunit [Marinomonas mediterranea]|jgi:TRAP-type uncharacterized transport system, periplasmic component|uniref:TAXI family TRAP transporter solute-binding subunit n=1 Tax=Marinomonas mediterranea TaxID=119864 RepID=UPI001CC05295|nr:TAXI family TRAP transporter solute-binding subunit [Marinomonas mediterranea]